MKKSHIDSYIIILSFCLVCYIINYILIISGNIRFRHGFVLDAILYVGFFLSYMWRYRRENILCFELMAMPIGFIGLFFLDMILEYVPFLRYYDISEEIIKEKSATLQMIGWLAFLLGSVVAHNRKIYRIKPSEYQVDYKSIIYLLTGVLLLLIIYDYFSGIFDSWFYYSNQDSINRNERNLGLGHLTALILVASVVDVLRLKDMGVTSFKDYLKHCNKMLIAEWALISFLLFVSGNRNEMLLIMLPLIVSYSMCIKRIPNKLILAAGVAGAFLMVLAGSSRQEGVSLERANFGIEGFVVDFAVLGYDCDYMVKYTDQHHPIYFQDLPGFLLSGVPFLGNVLLNVIEYNPPERSSTLCTDSVGSSSGLGTSLIGDLYYGAGFLWVLVFMYGFGYLMSRLYNSNKNINKYLLLLYSYMIANSIYYVRSQWGFPITIIEYSTIILLIGDLLFRKHSFRKAID